MNPKEESSIPEFIKERFVEVTDTTSKQYNPSFPKDDFGQPKLLKHIFEEKLSISKALEDLKATKDDVDFNLKYARILNRLQKLSNKLSCICKGIGFVKSEFTGQYRPCGFCLNRDKNEI